MHDIVCVCMFGYHKSSLTIFSFMSESFNALNDHDQDLGVYCLHLHVCILFALALYAFSKLPQTGLYSKQ